MHQRRTTKPRSREKYFNIINILITKQNKKSKQNDNKDI